MSPFESFPERRPSFLAAALAAGLLCLAAACGGGDSASEAEAPEAAAPEVDLCGLLTPDEIDTVLGATVAEPRTESESLGRCIWPTPERGGPVVILTLERAVLDSFDEFVRAFGEEFGGENPPADEYHPVDGVPGDWAMYVAEEHMVRAFRGDRVLEVSAPGAEEAQVIQLAAHAMGRLP